MTVSNKPVPGWLVLMALLTMTGPLSIDMYLPAFPAIADELNATGGAVERTMAIYMIGMAIGQLIYGPLSDRYGRKLPLYIGLVLYIAACAGCVLANSMESLTAWRLVQALGGSACLVIPRAVIRDHYGTQASARALSLLMLLMGVAPIAAPILGAQVLHFAGWRPIFGALGVFAIALLVAMHFRMAETLDVAQTPRLSVRHVARTYLSLLAHRQFMLTTLAGGFGMGGLFAYITASPQLLIEVYGVSPQLYGVLFSINALGMIGAAQVNARLLKRHYPSAVLNPVLWVQPAVAVVALTLTLFGWMPLPMLIVCLLVYTAAQGFISPNSAALALNDQSGRLGAASAMMGTLQFVCATLIALAVSFWQTDSALSLMSIMLVASLCTHFTGRAGLKLTPGKSPH